MATAFIGEIRPVGFNFAPIGWALCNGQLLSIAQNTALFSLLGTQFGGDGISNFALPNLQGNVPLGAGTGVGLSTYEVGETGGQEAVALNQNQIPAHNHVAIVGTAAANEYSPSGNVPGVSAREVYSSTGPPGDQLPAVQSQGDSFAHNNMQPYLSITFVIALQGIYPSRP